MPTLLLKDREDGECVRYRFGSDEENLGLLQLDFATGDVHELLTAPGPDSQDVFLQAAVKVREHWRAGTFPDRG